MAQYTGLFQYTISGMFVPSARVRQTPKSIKYRVSLIIQVKYPPGYLWRVSFQIATFALLIADDGPAI